MKKATDLCFQLDVPLSKTINEYCALHKHVIQMGPINDDQLLAIWLINGLNDNPTFENIQSNIMSSADDPTFSSKMVIHCLIQQDDPVRRRAEQNPQTSTILAAQGRGKPRSICTHCKKPEHLADFCIQSGGKMAGRSLDDARAAQRAFTGKQPRGDYPLSKPAGTPSGTANVATSDTKASPAVTTASPNAAPKAVVIGGVTYYPATSQSSTACLASSQPAHIDTVDSDDEPVPYSYHAFLALNGPVTASVDWNQNLHSVTGSDARASPVISHSSCALVAHADDRPFILDSGASNHISPERTNF
jgi:hypothetical protein